ncbi:hypothetical protein HDU85_002710, partial [Gaertneriomyces sp. JEL0708]
MLLGTNQQGVSFLYVGGGANYIDLTYLRPNSSQVPVVTRLRATRGNVNGDYLFAQDVANSWITQYVYVNTQGQLGFLRTINVFGFKTFEVSLDARYLATGGIAGAQYIDFIDVYDLEATSGDGYMYRLLLEGFQSPGFSFDTAVDGQLSVIVGVNNTISQYFSSNGSFYRNIIPNIPSGFNIDAIASISASGSNNFAVFDCSQPRVAFFSTSSVLAPSSYPMGAFNQSQCGESLTAIINQ